MISKLIGSAGFLSSGGTIGGDLTISGDLTVEGDNSGAYSEIITDGLQITKYTDGEFVSLILVNESDAASTAAGAIIYEHGDDNFKLNYTDHLYYHNFLSKT